MSVLAAMFAAAALGLSRRRSASGRLRRPGEPALPRLVAAARARLTRRAAVARRKRDAVAVVRALAAELRAGAPEPAALAAATATAAGGGLGSLLRPAAAATARGAPVAAELRRVGAAPGAARLIPVAAAWTVAARHGCSMTGLLDRLADAYDDEDADRADLAASVAGARASMLLLAGLPLAGIALGAAIGGHPWTWLLGAPAGWVVCLLAAVLDGVGVVWTRWLLRPRP